MIDLPTIMSLLAQSQHVGRRRTMKRQLVSYIAFGLVAALFVSGSALSLCDYISPTTSISRLRLSFTYRYFDNAMTDVVDVSAGRSRLDYSSLYDSANLGYSLSASGELALSALRVSSGTARSSGTIRHYFGAEAPLFAFAGLSASFDSVRPSPALEVTTGLGYGRFSDVTPLAKAMRIESTLLHRGALPAALDSQTVMTLAREVGRRDEYPTVDDLVEVLVSAVQDAANVRLEARTVLAIEDIVLATGEDRYCGWATQAGLSYEVLDPREGPQDLLLSASASLALPPTPESQIVFEARLTGPIDIGAQHTATLSASYEYSARGLDVNAALLLTREKLPEEEPEDSASASLEVSFPVGGANVGVQLAVSKAAEAARASTDLSVTVMWRLL